MRLLRIFTKIILLISLSVWLTACGGGGGGGGSGTDTDDVTGVQFHIKNARAVLTYKDTFNTALASKTSTVEGHYKIGQEPILAKEVSEGETNLVAVDDSGNSWPAIISDYQIRVMYSTTSPEGEYLYLALDGMSDNGNAPFITENNCAFYRVKVSDDSFSCVMEGVHLVDMNQQYALTLNGGHKPIQFDSDGNIYFLAWMYEVFCMTPDADDPQCNFITHPHGSGWHAYRANATTLDITTLISTERNIRSFIALPSGDVVIDSYIDQYTAQLEWFNADTSALIPMNPGNGVQFYAKDEANNIIWGDWDDDIAVRFSRRGSSGNLEHAGISKDLLRRSIEQVLFIDRLIMGDNGHLYVAYGIHDYQRWNDTAQLNDTFDLEVVQQILPYDPVPVAVLEFPDITNTNFWQWLVNGPFYVSADHFYYIQPGNNPAYGSVDTIHMIELDTRTDTTLLSSEPYDIYNWRLAGNNLYFAAYDYSRDTVVFGTIDTAGVQQGIPQSDYLMLQDVGSMSSAINSVEDIEIITSGVTQSDPGGVPVIENFHINEESLHAISVNFSKYMNHESVTNGMTLSDGILTTPHIPVWLDTTLHLIPDLDDMANFTSEPLATSSAYNIAVNDNVEDVWGNLLSSGDTTTYPLDQNFTTHAATGWYAARTDAINSPLSAQGAIRHLVDNNTMETYNMGVDIAGNIRIDFSARHYTVTGITTILWDQIAYAAGGSSDYNDGLELAVSMNGQPPTDNIAFTGNTISTKQTSAGQVMNGEWRRYRLDIVGNTATLYTSEDGVTYTAVTNANTSGLPDRIAAGSGFRLLFRMDREIMMDQLRVQPLDASGIEIGTALLSESFQDGSGNPDMTIATDTGPSDGIGFDEDVTNDYGLSDLRI